jgi:hypothetical protein
MGPVACDLCGKAKGGNSPFAKHGALSLCSHCAGLFGHTGGMREEPGSLAGFAVAKRAEETAGESVAPDPHSDRSTLVVERVETSATPTWRVPAPRLDELVKDLDGQFQRPSSSVTLKPTQAPPVALSDTEERPPAPRARRADASAWGKGIMASAGITLAVMVAFLSLKSSVPKGAGVPSAMAREPVPVAVVSAKPLMPVAAASDAQPRSEAVESVAVAGAKQTPIGDAPLAPAAFTHRAPAARPAKATKPAVNPAPARHAAEATPNSDLPAPPDANAAGPIPAFGGRD